MIEQQSIIVIRQIRGVDLLCLQRGERAGDIFRIEQINPLAPSGQWKLRGIVQPWGFGYRDRVSLDGIAALDLDQTTDHKRGDRWTYKNGKPRYTALDFDHGTNRMWGGGIRKLSRWTVESVTADLKWRRANARRMNAPAVDNILAAIERHLEAHA